MLKNPTNHPLLNPLLSEKDLDFKHKRVFLWYGARELLLAQFIAIEARLTKEEADLKRYLSANEIHDGPIFQGFAYRELLTRFERILN